MGHFGLFACVVSAEDVCFCAWLLLDFNAVLCSQLSLLLVLCWWLIEGKVHETGFGGWVVFPVVD